MLYTAIENYRQSIVSYYDEWLTWIASIRRAKMQLWKEINE